MIIFEPVQTPLSVLLAVGALVVEVAVQPSVSAVVVLTAIFPKTSSFSDGVLVPIPTLSLAVIFRASPSTEELTLIDM
jgi:hypothetical protein